MSIELLPVCSTPKPALRDGYAGANAHIVLPFYNAGNGFWFASGQQYTFPGAEVQQAPGMGMSGLNKPDNFQKDCCSCTG